MADKHAVDPLAELDTLLRAELSAEPSQEFLPRVRERLRDEPEPSRWWRPSIIGPLAAAATVVLAVAVSLWTPGATTTPDTIADATRTAADVRRGESQVPSTEDRIPSTESRAPSTASRKPSTENRVPSTGYRKPSTEYRVPNAEVIVDARQRDALLSFVRLANSGALTDEAFMLTTTPPAAIEDQVKTIAVEPVAVSPIPAGGVLLLELDRK